MTQPQLPSSRPQPLVLASSSPRRRELLAEAGYEFTVVPPPPEIECGVCSELGPAGL
ncbi:MAG TPA: Maf family protein, partial [Lacipirellulaceae bacterium]|nr:Maf family protein [Lacipirellulaceae bacterium]